MHPLRHALIVAAAGLCSGLACADTGKLLLTGGVSSIDGAAGGGLTPWAVIGTNATEGEMGVSAHVSRATTQDYSLNTLGVVGFGAIGNRVAELAHAFGMNVLAHVPRSKELPPYGPFAFAGLDDLFEDSDVVSLHCPLTPENENMVNARLLARMKPTAFLVNTARGQLVDEVALAAALGAGKLGGAALDVLREEPVRPDNPLLKAPNCLITPHVAWASVEARRRLLGIAAANLRAFLAGNPQNVVNNAG